LPPTSSKPSSEKMLRDFSRSEVTGASGTSGDLRLGDSTLKLQADVEKLSVSRERKSDRT
jgi:propanediol dehydratase small subunit